MSRTFRRKHMDASTYIFSEDAPHLFNGDIPRWKNVYSDGITYEQYCVRAVAELHSDKSHINHYWRRPLPRWVRNMFQERPFRRETKRVLKLAMCYDELDGISIKRPKKDAYLY